MQRLRAYALLAIVALFSAVLATAQNPPGQAPDRDLQQAEDAGREDEDSEAGDAAVRAA